MKQLSLFLIVICMVSADKYPSYESVANDVAKYHNKNVVFQFGYAGVRTNVSRTMVRRGFRNNDYGQLYANDSKLAMLISKKGKAWDQLNIMRRGTPLICTGKVKKLNARSGEDFYYLVISAVKEGEEAKKEASNIDLDDIANAPQDFAEKDVTVEATYKKVSGFQKINGKRYKRLHLDSKITVVFRDQSVQQALKKIKKKTPIQISGRTLEAKIKGKANFVFEVKSVKSAIDEIENKPIEDKKFRRRRRRN